MIKLIEQDFNPGDIVRSESDDKEWEVVRYHEVFEEAFGDMQKKDEVVCRNLETGEIKMFHQSQLRFIRSNSTPFKIE
ncbi:MAG: hypothetical protein IJ494_00265 [Bacteroides sp.]|nr:hypothetical protein [Bacteroides sp.]